MLVQHNGKWFTTNAYNFNRYSPQRLTLFDIDENMKRREIIKKHFTIKESTAAPLYFLSYHDVYISAWSKGDKLEARLVIQAAVNTYIAMGGK